MDKENLARIESEFFKLRGMRATGKISEDEFEKAVHNLAIQDDQGRDWIIGTKDGKWYVSKDNSWVKSDPYRVVASPDPVPQPGAITIPPRRNTLRYIAIGLGAAILFCVGIACGISLTSGMNRLTLGANLPVVATPIVSPTGISLPTSAPFATSVLTRTVTITPAVPVFPTLTPAPPPTFAPSPVPTIVVRPEANCSNPGAIWENVTDGQTLKPYQIFTGTANADKFAGYIIEWVRPGNVLYRSSVPVVHGVLFAWNTFTVPNGEYLISLMVVLNDGGTLAPCVVRVKVAH